MYKGAHFVSKLQLQNCTEINDYPLVGKTANELKIKCINEKKIKI